MKTNTETQKYTSTKAHAHSSIRETRDHSMALLFVLVPRLKEIQRMSFFLFPLPFRFGLSLSQCFLALLSLFSVCLSTPFSVLEYPLAHSRPGTGPRSLLPRRSPFVCSFLPVIFLAAPSSSCGLLLHQNKDTSLARKGCIL